MFLSTIFRVEANPELNNANFHVFQQFSRAEVKQQLNYATKYYSAIFHTVNREEVFLYVPPLRLLETA